MDIFFQKYQGTGNDFIMIDHRKSKIIDHDDKELIKRLCDCKFGIGADGLILLEHSEINDFSMIYFNSDGRQSSMCGNGGRCIAQFARDLGIHKNKIVFDAIDGLHTAVYQNEGTVSLEMKDVDKVEQKTGSVFILNTGSPHYVSFVDKIPENIKEEGKKIRYSSEFSKDGINVNFAVLHDDHIEVSTYERGVEDETLSCGTGVIAVALASTLYKGRSASNVMVHTKGGKLEVRFEKQNNTFTNIWLTGPAVKVFEGNIRR